MFLPIPAIDLMDGQVVRLSRGRADAKTVYSDDPVAVAKSFAAAGAERLHVVDLDGAFGGEPRNLDTVIAIRAAVDMRIELGGGLRTRATVERVLEAGIDFAILGTSAVNKRHLVAELAEAFGPRLIVGIDAKEGKVALEGWVATADLLAVDFARELEAMGVGTIIATDIATDGMMTGPGLNLLNDLAQAVKMQIIASGGVRNVEDLLALRALGYPHLIGAISGRAVYEGTLDLADAIATLS